MPRRRSDKVRPLAAVDTDALVDPLQHLRERHQQIAGLQQQLAEAQQALAKPPLPSIDPPQGQWPDHNSPEAGLSHLYDALNEQRFQEVIEQAASLQGHPHAGEIAYIKGLAHGAIGEHQAAIDSYVAAQAAGFFTP